MVTGASTADLAIVLVDARKGVIEQSRRHAFLATLLRVPHLVLAVNKMDLVDYAAGACSSRSARSSPRSPPSWTSRDLTFIPISALHGDNVVTRSANMPWYDGPVAAAPPGARAHRLRPQPDRRAVPGAVRHPAAAATDPACTTTAATRARSPAACSSRATRCMHLPSGLHHAIAAIDAADGPVAEAFPPMSVTAAAGRRPGHLAAAT